MRKLTPKQKAFCEEYIIDLNGKQAAIRAGYSPKTAVEIATENLCKPHVASYLEQLKKERSDCTKIDANYVLNRLKEIDELDILDIMTSDMRSFKPLDEWPKAWRISISAFDMSELFDYQDGKKELAGVIKKIKWPDKTKNLELLGKHTQIKAFDPDTTINIKPVVIVKDLSGGISE